MMKDTPDIGMSSLSVASLVSISQTLAGLVQGMLGPCGDQTLLSTHTGKVLVTQDGWTVLSSLHLAHPVARLIMQSLHNYHSLHHDGSKTFVIYLSSILTALARSIKDEEGKEKIARIKIAHDLDQFLRCDLSSILKIMLQNVQTGQISNACSINTSSEMTQSELISRMKMVLRTSLSTSLQQQLVYFFTDLLCSFVHLDDSSVKDIHERLSSILQYFEMYHTKVTTQPQQRAFICQGLLVEADLQPVFYNDTEVHKVSKNFILININFDHVENGRSKVLIKPSAENLSDFFSYKRQRLKLLLEHLKLLGVTAMFCADLFPDFAVEMCREEGLFVFCLSQERIEFLSRVTGVPILKELNLEHVPKDISEAAFSARIGSVIDVGNKRCTMIRLDRLCSTSVANLNHIVVCAPTEGMCDQLCKSLCKALTVLQMCLQPLRAGDRMRERDNIMGVFSYPKYVPLKLNCVGDIHESISTEHADLNLDHRECCVTSGSCNTIVSNLVNSSLNNSDVITNREFDYTDTPSHQNENICFNLHGMPHSLPLHSQLCTIHSGGVFEVALCVAICDYFSESISSRSIASRLVQEMLASGTQILHSNLCSDSHRTRRQFTSKWTSMMSKARSGHLCALDSRGEVCSATESLGLESLTCRQSLVSHVLQLVVQLVRMDAVVSVTRLPEKSGDSENNSDFESEDMC